MPTKGFSDLDILSCFLISWPVRMQNCSVTWLKFRTSGKDPSKFRTSEQFSYTFIPKNFELLGRTQNFGREGKHKRFLWVMWPNESQGHLIFSQSACLINIYEMSLGITLNFFALFTIFKTSAVIIVFGIFGSPEKDWLSIYSGLKSCHSAMEQNLYC